MLYVCNYMHSQGMAIWRLVQSPNVAFNTKAGEIKRIGRARRQRAANTWLALHFACLACYAQPAKMVAKIGERSVMVSGWHTAFDTLHFAVPGIFVLVTLVLTMSAVQPVLIICSLVGGLAYSMVARGSRATLLSLRWQIPFVLLVSLVNPLFSAEGSTEIMRIGVRAIYAESLIYGLCMGGLFVASVLWFEAAARLIPADSIMALLGRVTPTVALMISQCMRLIPRLVRQGEIIADVQDAFVVPGAAPMRAINKKLRLFTVLMGWSLENSLETADAMRARGWGASHCRTRYERYHFGAHDALCLCIVILSGVVVAVLAWAAMSSFSFYPQITGTFVWWGYAPYAVWMLMPAVLHVRETVMFR